MGKYLQYFFWHIFQVLKGSTVKKYGIEFHEINPEPEEPFFLIANHSYYNDGFFVSYAVKKPVIYLSTDEISPLEIIGGKIFRCVYTEKGTSDVKAVFKLKKYLNEGESVGLFPEGDRCWDGRTDILNPNIARLVKIFKVPVRIVKLSGAYLSGPRWADNDRFGKISYRMETIPFEKLKEMNEWDIYMLLTTMLENNDIKNPGLKSVEFRGRKIAEGIHNLLWYCPECMSHDTLTGIVNSIKCTHCKKEWLLDGWGRISPKYNHIRDIQDWSDYQKEIIAGWINTKSRQDLLTSSVNIVLLEFRGQGLGLRNSGRRYRKYAKGRILLFKDSLKFIPDSDKEPFEFINRDIECYVEGLNRDFSFHYNGQRFKFLIPQSNSVKYLHFLQILNRQGVKSVAEKKTN